MEEGVRVTMSLLKEGNPLIADIKNQGKLSATGGDHVTNDNYQGNAGVHGEYKFKIWWVCLWEIKKMNWWRQRRNDCFLKSLEEKELLDQNTTNPICQWQVKRTIQK